MTFDENRLNHSLNELMHENEMLRNEINGLNQIVEKLSIEEERYRFVIESAGLGTWDFDIETGIAVHSLRHDQIFGYKDAQAEWSYEISVKHILPEYHQVVRDAVARAIENGILYYEAKIRWPDGSIHWIAPQGRVLYSHEGKPLRMGGIVADITERKMLEEAQKQAEKDLNIKNEELKRFIYTVSHDLKSPLVTIASFTSYLEDDINKNDREAQKKDIAYINNAVSKMGDLLNELLELSRIGVRDEPKSELLFSQIVQSALDLVAGRMNQKNVKVRKTGPDLILYGNEQRFIQVFQNLLDNAVKFMGDNPDPEIEIGNYYDNNRESHVLYVKDNGSGIDLQHHSRVFGLFQKFNHNAEGSGLGLALIKRIVEVYKGALWFESEGIGKGTTFFLTFENTREIDQK